MEQIRIRPHTVRKSSTHDALTLKGLGWLFTVAGAAALVFFPQDSMGASKMTLEFLGYLALPLFSFLLVEGFLHTSDLKKYTLTMLAAALLAEPFYDYACSGSWFVLAESTGQNPLMALTVSLVMLYFLQYMGTGSALRVINSVFIVIAGGVWAVLLCIRYGLYIIVITALFYLLRERKTLKNVIIGVLSLIWYVTPEVSLLLTHKYSGSRKEYNKYLFYAAYPAMWLVLAIVKLCMNAFA